MSLVFGKVKKLNKYFSTLSVSMLFRLTALWLKKALEKLHSDGQIGDARLAYRMMLVCI